MTKKAIEKPFVNQQDYLRVAWHTGRIKYWKLYTADALRDEHVDATDGTAMESSSDAASMLYCV